MDTYYAHKTESKGGFRQGYLAQSGVHIPGGMEQEHTKINI